MAEIAREPLMSIYKFWPSVRVEMGNLQWYNSKGYECSPVGSGSNLGYWETQT